MNPNFVMFPISETDFIKVPRPIAMPLGEMHGEKILTIGYDDNTGLMAYQLREKPYKICYAYPMKKTFFDAIIHDLGNGMSEDDAIQYILDTVMVVEESCEVYRADHVPVNIKLKLSA